MSQSLFEKDSVGWQLRLWQQKIGEWWENILSNFGKNTPKIPELDRDFSLLGKIVQFICWTVVCLLAVWFLWQFWLLIRPYLDRQFNFASASTQQKSLKRVEELSVSDWLIKSRKFQLEGNYHQGCICLYQATLQKLNDSNLILHQPSRTDGEYLKLVKTSPQFRAYQIVLIIHQQLCFSDLEASDSLFQECQQAYQDIEGL